MQQASSSFNILSFVQNTHTGSSQRQIQTINSMLLCHVNWLLLRETIQRTDDPLVVMWRVVGHQCHGLPWTPRLESRQWLLFDPSHEVITVHIVTMVPCVRVGQPKTLTSCSAIIASDVWVWSVASPQQAINGLAVVVKLSERTARSNGMHHDETSPFAVAFVDFRSVVKV